jgi:pyruvate formate lyase activating enzyme
MDTHEHPAAWWHAEGDTAVCDLCPHACRIGLGHVGRCGVRMNREGALVSLAYGRAAAVHVDPIEKKPLYHFLPGTRTFSLGTFGCNLSCKFCQNYELSMTRPVPTTGIPQLSPDEIAEEALRRRCQSVALTYNEPTIWAEYGLDIARAARAKGLKMVSVTNGYIQPGAAEEFYRFIDAANVDLKAFDDGFYRRLCGATLQPVLDTLKLLRKLGVWIEVTNLVIPEENDRPEQLAELVKWVCSELGPDTPLHFSAFFPCWKLLDRPVTPRTTLELARKLALEAGLRHVHLGNLHLAE